MWSFIDKDKRTFYWTFVEFCVLLQEKMCVFICILKKNELKARILFSTIFLNSKTFDLRIKAKAKE